MTNDPRLDELRRRQAVARDRALAALDGADDVRSPQIAAMLDTEGWEALAEELSRLRASAVDAMLTTPARSVDSIAFWQGYARAMKDVPWTAERLSGKRPPEDRRLGSAGAGEANRGG